MQYVSAVSFLAVYGIIIPVADREKPSLKELWRQTPHKPGVYIMKDALGNTIYVGKAKCLRRRVASYFPGGKGFSGKVDLTEKGGDLSVDAGRSGLSLPSSGL